MGNHHTFDMKHKTVILQRLSIMIGRVDETTAKIISAGMFTTNNTLRGFTKDINTVLKESLCAVTKDTHILTKGYYPLSVPENWDAVNYWLCDINKHYVPALKRAKEAQHEDTTCT